MAKSRKSLKQLQIERIKKIQEYNRETRRSFMFYLKKVDDAELIKHLDEQPSKNRYIRDLIYQDYLNKKGK